MEKETKKDEKFDTQYTANFPREEAFNEVIGGPPEDMNAMPAAEDPETEGPTYDGSTLDRSKEA